MYIITVYLPDVILKFTVKEFNRTDGRLKFIDRKTNLHKDFPDTMCAIEEVEG